MKKELAALAIGIGWCFSTASAQCPATSFSAAPTACVGEQIQTANTSGPGTYSWDFCTGDFLQTPSAQLIGTLPGVNGRPGIEFAFDTKWYAFVTGTFSNVLYRLDFDAGLQSNPTAITNLGTLGGVVNQPGQIRVLQESGQWYGILHNTGGELIKLTFGSQLSNIPVGTPLISGVGYINSGLAVGRDAVHGYVCVLSNSANQFSIVRLGLSLGVPNPVTDVLTSASVPNPNNLGDLDLIYSCGSWYGVAVNLGNGNLYRLDFGSSLFAIPAIVELNALSASNPGRLRLALEGNRYYFLTLALDGTLTKGDFGSDLTAVPSLTNEGNLGGVLTASMYGLGLVKENSTWGIIGANQANGQYFRINYADNCQASPKTSNTAEPAVSYAASGTYFISLHNSSGGSTGSAVQSITVSAQVAPDISFTSINNCALHNTNFTSLNVSGNIVSYDWDFGDGQGSTDVNPIHVYSSAGTWTPALEVMASNGCSNRTSGTLDIYNEPAADFSLPAAVPLCTNQMYDFDNLSIFDPGSDPLWEWRVNGVLVSGDTDLSATFTNPISQEIRLKAIIPGCENERVRNILSVLTGPLVSFSASDDCAGDDVAFTNSTTGADAGYQWDFGDGSPVSTQSQPTHPYASDGVYMVSLTGSNAAGCNNVTTSQITIYQVPQPGFSVGLPPFSCSNSPTLFQNSTPGLTDSNIVFWFWEFGDPGSSTSTNRDPSFTYLSGGNYNVSLTATSDAGCENSVTLPVTIGTSPLADFLNGPACVNQPTLFSDISSGGVQSRTWQIGGSLYSNPSPTHTFTSSSVYQVTLTVTNASGCNSSITKPVSVPVVPTLNLQFQNPCAGQPTTFTLVDNTAPPFQDNINSWLWNIAGVPGNGNPVTSTITLAGSSPVSVTTTHASGCMYTKSSNIQIMPSPVANFTASPDRGNAPLTVQFQNSSTGGSQYQWLFSSNPPGVSTAASPVHTFLELGDYVAQLTVTHTNGCADVKTLPITVLVPAIDLSLTAFALTPDALTGKLRPTVTIQNNSNIPIGIVEVVIHLSGKVSVSEALAVNLGVGATITKTLSTTIDAGSFVCAELLSEKDVAAEDNRQCLNFEEADFVIDPYPNPGSGMLHVDWIAGESGLATITIYNSQGRREYEWQSPSAVGLNQSVHDLTLLSSGIYFVTVQTATTRQTRRIVRP